MKSVRELTMPAYLFACILLGGSSQSIWGALALQLIAILILAWAAFEPSRKIDRAERMLLIFCILLVSLFLLQLIPMPPAFWTRLAAREIITQGYRTLGRPLPWLPLSVAPFDTLTTLLTLLPPLAVIAAVLRLRAYKAEWCAAAIFLGTATAILLGFMQITTGNSGNARWYLYPNTNLGSAVGFFANRNHMGTLLLVALAFVPPLFFGRPNSNGTSAAPLAIVGTSALLVILLGIAMNGSLAAVMLAVPVLAASGYSIAALGRLRSFLAVAAGITLISATIFLAASPVQPKVTGETIASIEGRKEIWNQTDALIGRTFPFGTGFGTFEKVYASAEPLAAVDRTYVNHAHNDGLELVLEGGAFAAFVAAAFLLWWLIRAWEIHSARSANSITSAAIIASGALLAHSMVDYPLRTTALASIFAFCVAIMAAASGGQWQSGNLVARLRRRRHLKQLQAQRVGRAQESLAASLYAVTEPR